VLDDLEAIVLQGGSMKGAALFVIVYCLSMYAFPSVGQQTTKEIKSQMIRASIASYPGNCPCPYSRASNGSRCGKRSAWSKPSGYMPLCYPTDISEDMV